jgi:hypothetical protein
MPCIPVAEGHVIRSWLAIVSLALTPRLAWAADDREALEAEHVRLSEEVRMLATRNAWRGVEASYEKLEDLERHGVALTADDLWYGAQAARSLGDLSSAYARLKNAQSLGTNEAIDQWANEIEKSYGPVDLSVDVRYAGTVVLAPAEMPFDPEGRSAIEAAQESLQQTRAYRGILPRGRYELGGETFEVGSDGRVATVALTGRGSSFGAAQETATGVGARASIGIGLTDVGDTSADSLQPRGFLGEAFRVGVGVELDIARNLGWFVEAGYHGTLGTPVDAAGNRLVVQDSVALRPNVLHLGYGWTGVVVHAEDVAVSLGPTIGVGGGAITGVSDGCASGCAGLGEADPGALDYQRLSGTVRAAGGTVGVLWQLMDVGALRGGLDLVGGAYDDGARLYPWGALAYAIAPAPRRR